MKPTIDIQPRGSSGTDAYVLELRQLTEILAEQGVDISETKTRVVEPVGATIIVTVLGAVASSAISFCIDRLMAKRKSRGDEKTKFILVYKQREYKLPDEREALDRAIREQD